MANRFLRIALVSVLCLVFILFRIPEWYSDGEQTIKHLLYPFFHANVWHLLVNCIAVWSIYSPKRKGNLSALAFSLLVSFLVYPMSRIPCIGISNVLYATIGLRTPSLESKVWLSPSYITFILVTVAMLFFPQLSGLTHIVSFVMGIFGACVVRIVKRIKYVTSRY